MNTQTTLRAASYARISEKKERDKVADQHSQNRKHATARGYSIVAEFTDDGISALGGKVRPGFEALLLAAERGEFDVIVATEEERLARNVEEKLELGLVCEAAGVVWDTGRDGYLDPSTDSGEFMSTVRAAMGRIESRRKARRQLANNAELVSDGLPVPGKRRFGFLGADANTGRKMNTEMHPVEGEQVRALFADYLDGASIVSLSKRMGWRTLRVRDTLSNPAYAGWVVRRGERFEAHGSVARIIEREDFERVQARLSDNTRQTRPGGVVSHVASGIACCGVCGGHLQYRNAYLCLDDLSHPCIKGELLENRIRTEIVRALMLPGIAIESDSAGAELAGVERRTAALRAKQADILSGLDDESLGLTMAKLKPRLVPIARELAELEERQRHLTAESTAATMLAGLKRSIIDAVTHRADIGKAAEVATQLEERFEVLDIDRKRELIRGMVEIRVMPGRSPERVKVRHLTGAGQVFNESQEEAQEAA